MDVVLREPPVEADDVAREVIGAAIAVHKQLGPGFLERMYEEALSLELDQRCIPFEKQKTISVRYKGAMIGDFRLDLVVRGLVVVELKCVDDFDEVHFAQVSAYLRASGLPLGLLLNFNRAVMKHGVRRVLPRHY